MHPVVKIIVDGGSLIINGVSGNPVTLTSSAGTPNAGDWGGIRAINGGSITIRYATIEYATTAIDYRLTGVLSSTPLIEDSIIRNMSANGLYLDARAGAQLSPTIQRNTIAPLEPADCISTCKTAAPL